MDNENKKKNIIINKWNFKPLNIQNSISKVQTTFCPFFIPKNSTKINRINSLSLTKVENNNNLTLIKNEYLINEKDLNKIDIKIQKVIPPLILYKNPIKNLIKNNEEIISTINTNKLSSIIFENINKNNNSIINSKSYEKIPEIIKIEQKNLKENILVVKEEEEEIEEEINFIPQKINNYNLFDLIKTQKNEENFKKEIKIEKIPEFFKNNNNKIKNLESLNNLKQTEKTVNLLSKLINNNNLINNDKSIYNQSKFSKKIEENE